MQGDIKELGPEKSLTFALLGPIRAWCGGVELALGSPQQCGVLALLLLHEGKPVTVFQIADAIWGGMAPASATATIRTYLYRLRRLFDAADCGPVIALSDAGYTLKVGESAVDVTRFHRMVELAGAAEADGAPEVAVEHLRAALSMYKGLPLAGSAGSYVENQRTRLDQVRVGALEHLFLLELARGRALEIVEELHVAVADQPFREPLRELLIESLYHCGRHAEALLVYEEARQLFRSELGTLPGLRLRKLHERVLRSDSGSSCSSGQTERSTVQVRPAQLPADFPIFVGREDIFRSTLDWFSESQEKSNRASLIIVQGVTGVGKTVFALRLAHRVAARFPDGQLYVNLRGAEGEAGVCDPQEIVRGLLYALGVPLREIPPETESQYSMYHRLVGARRLLIFLDGAADSAQVRSLVSEAAGSVTVVTTRTHLACLDGTAGSRVVNLGLLSGEEAWALLAGRIGQARMEDETSAAWDIINRCGRLPLALSIACARISSLPQTFPLAGIATELFDPRAVLDDVVDVDVVVPSLLCS